jgi:hypothetical protein
MQVRTSHVVAVLSLTALPVLFLMSRVEDSLREMQASVDTKVTLAQGKASYLPGAACVIAASPEQTPADIVNFARACAKSHELWLEENADGREDR